MQKPPLDPDVAEAAPTASVLNGYAEQHLISYLCLLGAAAKGADWKEVARVVLRLDPAREPDRARRVWENPPRPGTWMSEQPALRSAAARRTERITGFPRLDTGPVRRLA